LDSILFSHRTVQGSVSGLFLLRWSSSGSRSSSRGLSSRSGLRRRGSSGCTWSRLSFDLRLSDQGDHDVAAHVRPHAFRKRDITNVNRLSDIQRGHIEDQSVWKMLWKAADFEIVVDVFEQATRFDADWRSGEVHWNFSMNFFISRDRVEVDVQNATLEVVVLHFLDESELLSGFTIDLQIHQNILGSTVLDNLGEGLGVDFEKGTGVCASVKDGGDEAFLTEAAHRSGAGALTFFCG
jgi:hypothetical protein